MSGATRLGIVAVAAVIGVVAFAVLHPGDEKEENAGAEAAEQGSNGAPSESAPKQIVPVLRPGATRTIEVQRDELVRFVVRWPRADEAHVHGYDILKQVPPGGASRSGSGPSSRASSRSSSSTRARSSGPSR